MRVICYPIDKKNKKIWKLDKKGLKSGGRYSNVYQVCKNSNCEYVMKVISADSSGFLNKNFAISSEELKQKIIKEVCIQNICAEEGLCKPVEDWWMCEKNTKGVIITPLLKETVFDYLKRCKPLEMTNIIINVLNKIYQLHEVGIYHGDINLNNIMIDEKKNVYFIDMGSSGILEQNENAHYLVNFDYERLINYISDYLPIYIEEKEYYKNMPYKLLSNNLHTDILSSIQ